MPNKAYLVLEDGSVFEGEAFGAPADAYGEVVFNTSMTGYQEVLTDPSYAGQMVVLTYPLVGNYGVNAEDFESRRIQVAAFVVREHSTTPSHGSSNSTLSEFLASQGIPGISGVDTRAITRRLRSRGVMMGFLGHEAPEVALARLAEVPRYDDQDFVRRVSTDAPYRWDSQPPQAPEARYRVLVSDCGLKYNILRLLRARGCEVLAVPVHTTAEEIMAQRPDGLLLSPGPGDPALLDYVVSTARQVAGRVPTLGICLGHQVVARAFGGKTFKLKFGHRGANHPVKDTADGSVHITAQNHGYAVDPDSLPAALEVSHINLNDNTVEGLRHRELPIITIQYHSEASPGPRDNEYMFDKFMALIEASPRPARGRAGR
jgi:carbamoyl-phosphate synthase small subunit